mmetsp:Transcript_57831/g.161420  ORF Transcript_57831/g.161420 Transcript_57831/m.161420 type:complete len:282 (-) Transcript_57831:119-964(-)
MGPAHDAPAPALSAISRLPVFAVVLCSSSAPSASFRSAIRLGENVKQAEGQPNNDEIETDGPGIAVPIRYHDVKGEVLTFPERKPYATHLVLAVVKTAGADVLVQFTEKRSCCPYEPRRGALFLLFGLLYVGLAEWALYVHLFTWLCPNAVEFANKPWGEKIKDPRGLFDLAFQAFVDNFIQYTFMYFPAFYMLKEIVQGANDQRKFIVNGIRNYCANFKDDNLAVWSFWLPVDIVVFSCPMWLRLPVNHFFGLLWVMILSYKHGAEKVADSSSPTAAAAT